MENVNRRELRDKQCKVYVEASVKTAIQQYADRHGLTFSEAGRELWLNSDELNLTSQEAGAKNG